MAASYIDKQCIWCNRTFQALLKEVKRGKGNACSVSCANAKKSSDKKVEGKRKAWIEEAKKTEHYITQRKAHSLVWEALRRGDLTKQPCEECGRVDKIHAHHDDYTKPLMVHWLCVSCHRKHHG